MWRKGWFIGEAEEKWWCLLQILKNLNSSGGQNYNKYHIISHKNISGVISAFTNTEEAQLMA